MANAKIKYYVMPFLGMSFFWVYLRYQSFFGVLYPFNSSGLLLGESLSVYEAYLAVLFCLSIAAGLSALSVERFIDSRRGLVLLFCCLGSLGVVFGVAAVEGYIGVWARWVSVPLVVIGFLASYLAWARYFCLKFDLRSVVLLAASYFFSLLAFSSVGIVQWSWWLIAVLTPCVTGVCWYFSEKRSGGRRLTGLPALKVMSPYAVLFIAFLLAGSVIRGIVDVSNAGMTEQAFRWPLSIVIAGLIFVSTYWYTKKVQLHVGYEIVPKKWMYRCVERMVLWGWTALALLFFVGVFWGLIGGTYGFAGHIVVVSRSTLDFLFWIMLCNVAYHKALSPVFVFTVCSVMTNVISWLLSYVIIPRILVVDMGLRLSSPDLLVLVAMFALLTFIIFVFGGAAAHQKSRVDTNPKNCVYGEDSTPMQVVASCGLTEREIEVTLLYSQGHSMKKVASQLYISTSTAQSHIKSAYRKLDVHSKDQLIEKISDVTRTTL